MKPANDAVIASLAAFVETQLPEWYGEDAAIDLSEIDLKVFPYSFFLHIPVKRNAENLTLLAKIKRQPDTATLSDAIAIERLKKPAQDEYAMTKKIWDAFNAKKHEGCTAVEPFAYLEAWNALLMQKIEGKALKVFLLDPKLFFLSNTRDELKKMVRSSARWLRVFHDKVSEMQEITFPVNDIRFDLEESFLRLERYSNGNVNIAPYQKAFEKALREIEHLKVPFGIVHDDYHYSNILVDMKNQVCAIDNAGTYQACAYVDLATLITDPQTRSRQIMTGGLYISSRFIDECKKAILANYFEQETYSEKVVHFFCALAVLNKWSEGLARFSIERQRKMPSILLKQIENYFSKLLLAYL